MSDKTSLLTDERRDALQEVVNIAMGQAGSSLASIVNEFVELSIPQFHLARAEGQLLALKSRPEHQQNAVIIRQPFIGQLRGEAFVLINAPDIRYLAGIMGYQGELNTPQEQELLLDIGNVIAGACLNGLAGQLDFQISYAAPAVYSMQGSLAALLDAQTGNWPYALLMEIRFRLTEHSFTSHLIFMMTEDSIDPLTVAIDRLLSELQ